MKWAPGYNRVRSVELLSNLIWVAVTIVLWALWLAHGRRTGGTSTLPTGLQVVALVMLTAILLPAISVSDDLQASHSPAEVERVCGKSDQHLYLLDAAHHAPVAFALVVACALFAAPRRIAFVPADPSPILQRPETPRALWSRPPPAA